jgi:hypothetical protein
MRPGIKRSRLKRVSDLLRLGSRLIAGMAIGSAALMAQDFMDTVTTAAYDLQRVGFTFRASAFSSYTSWNGLAGLNVGIPSEPGPNYLTTTGVTLTLGWQKRVSEDSTFNIFYSPYYAYEGNGIHSTSYTSLSPLRGTFSLNWRHKLGRKWHYGLGGSAVAGNFDQTAFLAGTQGVTSFAGSSGDLGGLSLGGQGVGGTSAIVTPQQALLYGNTFLSTSATVSLEYAASPRLTITGNVSGTYMRHLNDSAEPSPYLLNQATSGSVALTINYSMAARTNLFANATYNEPFSSLVRSENGLAFVGINRTISEHFFGRVYAGAGYTSSQSQDQVNHYQFHGTQSLFSVSGGYRLYSNSFSVGFSKTLADFYGIGTSSIGVTGGWHWRKPGSDWGLQASGSEFWLQGGILGASGNSSNAGYLASVGVNRIISRRVRMSLQYVYSSASLFSPFLSAPTGPPARYSLQVVRLNIAWSPHWVGPGGQNNAPPADFPNAIP